ncbi:PHP domain-containing protein [Anatilimnocola sp. NA78]|uniref:PHP domain-containing protein n=1 Tax=Anatilimnocola sp. NA78 TaxID=3415683 RepID=UPI003CE5B023
MLRQPLALTFALLTLACAVAAEPDTAAKPSGLKWYKGNTHTHSLWSDGNDFPEMICEWYKSRGYHFLALSDHNLLSVGEKWVDSKRANTKDAIGGLERFRERFKDRVQTKEEDGKTMVRLSPLSEFRPLFEEPEKFLLIQAEEITDSFKSKPIHINGQNLQEAIKPQGGDSLRATISNNLRAIEQQGKRLKQPVLGHLNHPNYQYAVTAEDMAHVAEEKFFEVYNGHPGVNHLGDTFKPAAGKEPAHTHDHSDKGHSHSHAHPPVHHASIEKMWDIANTIRLAELKRPPLFGLGTDDSHNYFGLRGASPGRGWVVVRAPELTVEALLKALHAGDFYASSGIVLKDFQWDPKSKKLSIEIEPQPGVTYATALVGSLETVSLKSEPVKDEKGIELPVTRKYSPEVGKTLQVKTGTSVTFQLTGKELYARAVVTSSRAPENPSFPNQKEQAWLQPVGWEHRVATTPAK